MRSQVLKGNSGVLMLGAALLSAAAAFGVPIGNSGILTAPAMAQLPAAGSTEPVAVGGPAVVRRLTEAQYRATIADIFGPNAPIAGHFERGQRESGLLSLATSTSHISSSSLEQYHASAQSVAAYALNEANRDRTVGCKPAADNAFDAACAQQFVEQTGMLLFRRPVSREEMARYLGAARAGQEKLGSFYKGLQYTLAGMLVAPEFLLRIERVAPGKNELDAWSKASRLSFLLTDASPDRELLRAAAAGELDTDAGLASQTDRLMASPNYERAVRSFFRDMLNFDDFAELSKDAEIFPAFNSKVVADAQEETLRTIVDLLLTRKGDYRDIFTTRDTFLSRPLGTVYRLPVAPPRDWMKTQFPLDSGRAGILSQISFLALNSHPGISSPTLRGKFIRQTFLCQKVPDPPGNVDFTQFSGPKAVQATARMRLASHNESPACAGCHKLTDPMGLTLESFDGLGMFRKEEGGAVIDTSGAVGATSVKDAVGLGRALHDDPQVTQCFSQKLYQSAVGSGADTQESFLNYLDARFKREGYRLPNLMRAIATSRNFYAVSSSTPATTAQANRKTGDRS